MKNKDYIGYKGNENTNSYVNKNLTKILYCIAFKYDITTTCIMGNKKVKVPKLKQTKVFICNKCFEYFEISISLKQISYLLKPSKGKFPYTGIVIIETIYNLLKEERRGNKWKEELEKYVKEKTNKDSKYEQFLLENIPMRISNRVDEYMESSYSELFECFVASRDAFHNVFNNISMEKHCEENFPSGFMGKKEIPQLMYDYQEQRIYLKEG